LTLVPADNHEPYLHTYLSTLFVFFFLFVVFFIFFYALHTNKSLSRQCSK